MADEEDVEVEDEPADMGVVVLMLGLYLIVLAFFILLNAISVFSEEKVEQASKSVSEGFGFSMDGKNRMRDDVQSAMSPVFKLVSQEIQSVMESYISVKDFRYTQTQGDMQMTIATDAFFREGQIKIRPSQAGFFSDIAKLLEKPRAGIAMVLDVIIVGTDDDVKGADISPFELAGRRSTLFSRALVNKGMDAMKITAKAKRGEMSEVILQFHTTINDPTKALKEAHKRGYGGATPPAAEPQAGPVVPAQ